MKLKGNQCWQGTGPSPHHQWEGQNRGEDRQMPVPRLVFPHPSPCIWTIRVLQSTYSKAASRLPRRMVVSPSELPVYDVWLNIAACEKEKEAAQATLDWIWRQEWDKEATQKKWEERELCRIWWRDAGHRLEKEGARQQEEYNHEWRASRAFPDHPLLIPWDGASTVVQERKIRESCMGWRLMEHQPHGPSAVSRENGLLMGPGSRAYQWTRQSTYHLPTGHPMS